MNVQLKGALAFYGPNRKGNFSIHLACPTPLAEILAQIKLPAGEVHLVVVNNCQVEPAETLVSDDDTLILFPPTDGG